MFHFQLHCLGISHHRTNVETRERFRFALQDIKPLMASNNGRSHNDTAGCRFFPIKEIVLLSTCNRIELYVCTDVEALSARSMISKLVIEASRLARIRVDSSVRNVTTSIPDDLDAITYYYNDLDVVRHLSRVACSLDSMVLGETQILSQIKDAQEKARHAGFIGPVLSMIFKTAQRAGKRARCHTAISCNPSSVSSAAVVLAKQNVSEDWSKCDIAVVGIGEMGQLALRTLVARGAGHLRLVNRTVSRATEMAAHIGQQTHTTCVAHGLDALPEILTHADVIITAAGANEWVVDVDMIACAMNNRAGRKLVVVDIGVPRNVDPKAAQVKGLQLLDSDDIKLAQDSALEARRKEIPKVLAVIDEEISRLELSLRKLRVRPLIDELRQKAEAIRQHELERTYRKLGSPDPVTWSHVLHFSEALVNKLFHDPTIYIQEKAALDLDDFLPETIRELFGLNKQ